MMPRISFSCLAILAFSGPVLAEPIYFSGSESAYWLRPSRDGGSLGQGTQTLPFGNGANLLYSPGPNFSAISGQPFILGHLTLSNSNASNVPSNSTLQVSLAFQNPSSFSTPIDIPTSFSLNPNGSVTASIGQGATTLFGGPNGNQYQLQVLGFSSVSGSSPTSTWTVQAGQADCTYIWAEVSDPSSCQTPEPSALALGAIGIGLAGLRRWRRTGSPL